MCRWFLLALFLTGTCAGVPHLLRPLDNSLLAFSHDERIIGGDPTTIDNVPYIVAILLSGKHMCGGSIIRADTILSAAHCFEGLSPSQISIRAGSTYKSSGGQVIGLSRVVIHENNNPNNFDNDVAVMKLSSSIALTNSAKIIPMISQNQNVPDGSPSRVSGWGVTIFDDQSSLSEELRTVIVPTVSQTACNQAYEGRVKDNMLCAGYLGEGGKDACQNDSGGPLVYNNMLIGVVSWGRECANAAYPGIYARVAYFRNWIETAANRM